MPSKSAKTRRPGPREQAPTRRIAIIAFPGVTLLDISGPAQVFAELQEIELGAAIRSPIFDLGQVGADKASNDGRYCADRQRAPASGRYAGYSGRPGIGRYAKTRS
jgi:hypothetical protein